MLPRERADRVRGGHVPVSETGTWPRGTELRLDRRNGLPTGHVRVSETGPRPPETLLSDFDPLAPESFDSFHREFAELRARCPVARSEA